MSAVSLLPITSSALAVGDPSATRTVYLTTIALVLLGIGLAVLAWWLVRRTRPEPELFAPLEQMETRSWRKLDAEERRASLDTVRPSGARPVALEQLDGVDAADEVGGHEDLDGAEDAPEVEPVDEVDEGERAVDPTADEDCDDPSVEEAEDDDTVEVSPAAALLDDGGDEISTDEHGSEDDPTVAINRAPST